VRGPMAKIDVLDTTMRLRAVRNGGLCAALAKERSAISKSKSFLANLKPLIAGTIMARKKPRKKTSVRSKRHAAPLKVHSQFVRREHRRRNGRRVKSLTPTNPFGRVVGLYLELPFRLARCTTPFQVWAEQMRTSQELLSAWQPR